MSVSDPTVRLLQLVNFDETFEFNTNQAGADPIVLNKFDMTASNYVDVLSEHIFSDGSSIDFIAKCDCGETEGNNKLGMTCPVCETKVQASHLLDDDHRVCRNWLSVPPELPHGWLTPRVYMTLANWLMYDKGKKNYLDDILDVESILPFEIHDVVDGRGFTYFHDNFQRLIDYFSFNHPVISKKPETVSIREFLRMNSDKIFCHYIPILNAAINPIFVVDSGGTNKKRYSDTTADYVMRAAISLSRVERAPKRKNRLFFVEKTVFKAYKDIIAYIEEATSKYISKKKAIPRTHIYGSRFHFSFRGVIVPIVGEHTYYELHVPWSMAVNTLRVHIYGELCRRGHTINEAFAKVARSLQIMDPEIKQIMDQLIIDSPFPGIPCLWDRPPSIRDGSVMLRYITRIQTDVNDLCVGISPLDVAFQNADFDGDRLLCHDA